MLRNFDDPLYKQWRSQVYARDKHTCQWPGCNKKKGLNAHHIKTWANYPGLRFVVDNGITLCKTHHKLIKGIEDIYEGIFYKIVAKNNGRLQ
jgi:predicted restriction endonuclease